MVRSISENHTRQKGIHRPPDRIFRVKSNHLSPFYFLISSYSRVYLWVFSLHPRFLPSLFFNFAVYFIFFIFFFFFARGSFSFSTSGEVMGELGGQDRKRRAVVRWHSGRFGDGSGAWILVSAFFMSFLLINFLGASNCSREELNQASQQVA